MSIFYEVMDSLVRGTLWGACLAINGYGLFIFIRFLYRKCRQFSHFLKNMIAAQRNG
jgi:hypothetical protein